MNFESSYGHSGPEPACVGAVAAATPSNMEIDPWQAANAEAELRASGTEAELETIGETEKEEHKDGEPDDSWRYFREDESESGEPNGRLLLEERVG